MLDRVVNEQLEFNRSWQFENVEFLWVELFIFWKHMKNIWFLHDFLIFMNLK